MARRVTGRRIPRRNGTQSSRCRSITGPTPRSRVWLHEGNYWDWRKDKPEEWLAICEREGPIMERRIVAQTQEIMARVGEIELRNALRLAENMEELTPKEVVDLAGAQQRLATAKGINGTKLLELTGRPTQVIENRSGADILRQLAAAVPGLIVEGTAVEEPVRQLESKD
jgi:hypothetical protein